MRAAERADVALVLVDSSEGVVEQDLAVADVARTPRAARRSSSYRSGTSPRWGSRTCVTASEAVSASAPRWPRSRRRSGRGVGEAPRPRGTSSTKRTRAGSVPGSSTASSPSCASSDPRRPAKGNRRLNLLYGTQVSTPPAALSLLRQRSWALATRDYGYWVENPPPRALRPRGRARDHRLRTGPAGCSGRCWGRWRSRPRWPG